MHTYCKIKFVSYTLGFSCFSAGGVGVILNLDRLALRLKMAGSKVKVRGLADSGWFLAGEELPMTSAAIRYGMK